MATNQIIVRLTVSEAVSLFFAETFALIHVAGLSLHAGSNVFRLPGVLPVATGIAACAAALFTPLGFWAVRLDTPHLIARLSLLWLVLAVVVLATSVLSQTGALPFIPVFAAIGVVWLRVAARQSHAPPN